MNLRELGNAFMFATVCDMFVNLIGYNIYFAKTAAKPANSSLV